MIGSYSDGGISHTYMRIFNSNPELSSKYGFVANMKKYVGGNATRIVRGLGLLTGMFKFCAFNQFLLKVLQLLMS